MKDAIQKHIASLCLFVICAVILIPGSTSADTIDQLQQKINEHNATITQLEKEIATYQAQVNQTAKQADTLKGLIKTLDTTKKQLDSEIALTQNKISATSLTLDKLGKQIVLDQQDIDQNQKGLAEALRSIAKNEGISLITAFLGADNITDGWADIKQVIDVQTKVKEKIDTLKDLTIDLQDKQQSTTVQKNNLQDYKGTLSDQQKVVIYNTQEKNKVLADTKNQEAAYQKTLNDKIKLRDAFQKELTDFESQLKLAVDPNSYPGAKVGVLSWPVDKVVITQYFGNTDFANAHQALYNGMGHNGIDLGVPIGTPIKAALAGTVMGSGDTDLTCPGASYGRWVLIRHNNGLSTLYAHLSVIGVTTGQVMTTGQTLGYSGKTGYATGPHLHFTVYATQGVEIIDRASAACGGRIYHMPIADLKAYLNPLSYLPAL